MNFAVGSRENSPMEQRRRNPFTVTGVVSGLMAAALVSSATLVNAQNGAAPAATPAGQTAPATAKKSTSKAGGEAKSGEAKSAEASPKSDGSYAIGVSVGENLNRAKVSPEQVSIERIAQGIRDSLAGKAKMS